MNDLLETPWLDPIIDFVASLVHQGVFAPILLLTLEESGIPLPIPGDIMIAFTGYNVSRGLISYPVALISLMVSILLGSSILYWLSSRWGNTLILKFGHFLHLHPERLLSVEKRFKKYGAWVIIFGRHIPGFRIPITVFAGISGVKYRTFILSTFVSTFFWVIFYLDLGIKLGPRVTALLKVSSSYVIILALFIVSLFVAWMIFQWQRNERKR